MTSYFGVVGNRDYIKIKGARRPFWEFLDQQPAGWLCSLAYRRSDLPTGPTIHDFVSRRGHRFASRRGHRSE